MISLLLLIGVSVQTYAQCTSNCVITNPTTNQVITQPSGTSLQVNNLVGNSSSAGSFTFGANPNIDTSSWNPAMLRIGRTVNLAGGSTSGSANQFATVIHMLSNPTSSAATYEKDGIFVRAKQADPSTYGNPMITRDAVAIHGGGELATANGTLGRVWGANLTASVLAGSDGLATGVEIDVINDAVAQPLIDQTNSKVGLTLVPMGSFLSSCGICFAGSQGPAGQTYPGFHRGMVIRNIVQSGDAVSIPVNAAITVNNPITAKDNNLLWAEGNFNVQLGSPGTPTITFASPGIWNDSPAMKHARFGATCTPPAGVGQICQSNYSWATSFSSSSYTATCIGAGAATGVPVIYAVQKSAGGVSVFVANLTATASSFPEVDCIAVHD